jgi:hypothetical protein
LLTRYAGERSAPGVAVLGGIDSFQMLDNQVMLWQGFKCIAQISPTK